MFDFKQKRFCEMMLIININYAHLYVHCTDKCPRVYEVLSFDAREMINENAFAVNERNQLSCISLFFRVYKKKKYGAYTHLRSVNFHTAFFSF